MFEPDEDNRGNRVVEQWEVLRLEELSALVTGLAGREDIRLRFGSNWAWSAREKVVLLPKKDLIDLLRCRAIASHEVGHVLFTRLMEQLNIPEEYKSIPATFLHMMHNVYEDPRIENGVGLLYPGAQVWLHQLHEEEEKNATSFVQSGAPLAMQYFLGHIREFHRSWQRMKTEEVDPLLQGMLDETREERIAMANLLPHCILEDGEELDLACQQEVEPRLAIQSSMLSPEEQRKHLAQARMMSLMEGKTRDYAFQLYILDEKRIQQVLNQMQGISERNTETVVKEAFGREVSKEDLEDIEISDEARKMLREWYEARRTKLGFSTESDYRKAKLRSSMDDPRARRRRGRGFGGEPSTETQSLIRTYDQMRMKVANQIQKLTQELQDVLRPTKAAKWKDGYSSGSKINLRKMIQREARNQGELDFWQRKTEISKRNVAATLLIDLSGSMSGPKSEAALQGAILFWEALHAMDIAASISGFKTSRIPILDFGEPIVQNNRKKIANMLNLVGSVNHDADAVRSAFTELIKQPADEHILIVISDGQPVGPDGNGELLRVVDEVKNRVHLIGLGLGPDTEHVVDFYPHAEGCIALDSLARTIGAVMNKVLRRY